MAEPGEGAQAGGAPQTVADDPVETMFEQLDRLVQSLALMGEPTLAVSVSTVASKSLLLAAASRFETQLVEVVGSVAAAVSSEVIAEFCVNQGLNRKYHTLFDWDSSNANKFFRLFGDDLKERAATMADESEAFKDSVEAFITLGRMRNELVHQDFASFPLEATLEELIDRYRSAREFLPGVDTLLRTAIEPAGLPGDATPS